MRYAFLSFLIAWCITVPAEALPPLDMLREAIDVSPALDAARAEVDRARATSKRLSVGPYEIQAQGGGGRRRVDNALNPDDRFTEWQANVSRSMRLPGKRAADKDLGDLEVAIAEADLAAARREAQMTFVAAWTAWRQAHSVHALAAETATSAQSLADAEAKGVRAGGARAVDADQLAAWAGFYTIEATSAQAQADNAKTALLAAFPALTLPVKPSALGWDDARIAALLIADAAPSPAAMSAKLVAEQAAVTANRVRQERIPDPTFGFQLSNEFGGQERSFLATVSIPLSGRARAAASREAFGRSASAAAQSRAAELEAERRIAAAKRAAAAAVQSLKQAQEAEAAIMRVLDRLEQGRKAGGVRLTELITARRTLYDAQRGLYTQRIAAEQSLMELAILLDRFV